MTTGEMASLVEDIKANGLAQPKGRRGPVPATARSRRARTTAPARGDQRSMMYRVRRLRASFRGCERGTRGGARGEWSAN